MRKRFLQIDILKCFAIIAVIALHSLTKPELLNTYSIYHIWQAVPVFMVLMGLNLGLGLRQEQQKLSMVYTRTYFTKKATRILLPFCIIFLISLLLGLVWQFFYQQDTIDFSRYTLIGLLPVSGKGNYFITLLLQSILVLPLLAYCFSKRPVLTTVALIVIEVTFLVISRQNSLFDSRENEYLYSAALPRYFSALAYGLWLSKVVKGPSRLTVLIAFLLLSAVSIVYLYLIIYGGLQIPFIYEDWNMQNVLSFGYAALLILLAVYVLPATSDNHVFRVFAEFGNASYHIFLVQVLYFGLATEHNNLLLNLAVCLPLGYLFYRVEAPLSRRCLSYL